MGRLDSTFDTVAIGRARALLKPPVAQETLLPVVAASGFAAATALALAFAVMVAPPVISPGARGDLTAHSSRSP